MSDSNPDRDRRATPGLTARGAAVAVLLSAALAVPVLPASAQSGSSSDEVGTPTQLIPFDRSSRQGSGALPGEALPEVQGIVVDRLRAIDPNATGLLDPDKEGLGQGLWKGSDRDRLESLLAAMPGDIRSRVLRDLARRALLSRAAPPEGDEPEPAEQTASVTTPGEQASVVAPRFLSLRIGRLLAMGAVEPLQRMLATVPRMIDDEGIQRARADSSFLAGDLDGGCREIRNGVTTHVTSLYWPKALVLCQLASGERAQAQLGLSLLQERGLGEDEAGFLALFDAVAGGDSEVPAEALSEPLAFAALQSAGLSPPEGFLDSAPVGILVAAALSDKTPAAVRLGAAEKASALGVPSNERLAALYSEQSFTADELLAADTAGYEGPVLRALRYQRIGKRKEPGALARALREALDAAADEGVYQAMVSLVADEFRRVPVQNGLAWFASTAGRTLFAAERVELASSWYQLARQQAVRNSAAQVAVGVLYPYYRLSGGPTLSQGGDAVTAWRAGLGEVEQASADRWEALLRAGLQGLAEKDPILAPTLASGTEDQEPDAEAAPANGAGSDAFAALKEASTAGRRGESLLIALGLIGSVPLDAVEPGALQAVVAALSRTGLQDEARSLAIEATVANGL